MVEAGFDMDIHLPTLPRTKRIWNSGLDPTIVWLGTLVIPSSVEGIRWCEMLCRATSTSHYLFLESIF